jgi:hypothetical protein
VDTGLGVFGFCLLWGDVADGGVDAPPIVIAFDIGEQVASRGVAIGVFAVVDELGFSECRRNSPLAHCPSSLPCGSSIG